MALHRVGWIGLLVALGCTPLQSMPEPGPESAPPGPEVMPTEAVVVSRPLFRHPGPCQARADYRGPEGSLPDGTPDVITDYAYDDRGRLTDMRQVQHQDDTTHYRTEEYRYDDADRLVWRRIESVGPIAYVQVERSHYDREGRLLRIDKDDKGKGKPIWRTSHDYDRSGRMVMRKESKVATGKVGFRRRFVYDDGQLVREDVDNAGKGTFPKTVAYEYDASGRVARRVHEWNDRPAPSEIDVFRYDDAGRLVRRTNQRPFQGRPDPGSSVAFTYDDAGNVLTKVSVSEVRDVVTGRTEYDYGCWADSERTEPPAVVIEPWEFRTQLNRTVLVSF